MNLDDETFEQWCREEGFTDPILYSAMRVQQRDGLSESEFCHLLIYSYREAMQKTQEAFKEHLEKCTMPHKVQLNN